MKNIAAFIIILFLSCSKKKNSPNFSGSWYVVHFFNDNIDILKRDSIKDNDFNVNIVNSKTINFTKKREIFFFLERSNPIIANYYVLKNNRISIQCPSNKFLSNTFKYKIDTIHLVLSGTESMQYNVTFESENCKLMMKRYELKH